jgi:hypothetical protein
MLGFLRIGVYLNNLNRSVMRGSKHIHGSRAKRGGYRSDRVGWSARKSFALYLVCGTDRMARSISAWILELLSMAMWEMPTSPPRLMFESLP